jgi:hypothetical protein
MDHEAHHESMDHHATPKAGGATPVALPGPGSTVQGDGLRIMLEAAPMAAGPVEAAITLSGVDGKPIEGARVVVLSDMPGMPMGRTETPAQETAPGRYVAEFVPLGMAGEWHLAVRVSPRAAATQVFTFAVVVP